MARRKSHASARTLPPLSNRIAMAIGRPTCHLFMKLFYRVRVEGYEHIPKEGPVIIIANHQSYFDPILVGLLARRRHFRAIARSTLFGFKPFDWLIKVYGALPVDQRKGDIAAFRAAIEEINKGKALVVYPEGGRTRNGRTQPFARGFHLVLRRTNAAVVPVIIEGAYDVWPAGRTFPRLHGRIAVRATPAVSSVDLKHADASELLPAMRRFIEAGRLGLRHELRARSGGRYPIEIVGDRPYWDEA